MKIIGLFVTLGAFRLTAAYLNEYVVPTGQFCPHRSNAWYQYMDYLNAVSTAHKDFAKVSEKISMKNQKEKISAKLKAFLLEWDRLAQFRKSSTDYQLNEYLSEPHVFNLQVAKLEADWIPFCQNLAEELHKGDNKLSFVSCEALKQKLWRDKISEQFPPDISAQPFLPAVFQTQCREVQLETLELLNEHKELIDRGEHFGDFSKSERHEYMDTLRKVEERWDIVFRRFQMIGGINPEYVSQCKDWLAGLDLDEEKYRQLHRDNMEKLMKLKKRRQRQVMEEESCWE